MASSLKKWTVAGVVMIVGGFVGGYASVYVRMTGASRSLEKTGEGNSGELSVAIGRILTETAIASAVIFAGFIILAAIGCVCLKRRKPGGSR